MTRDDVRDRVVEIIAALEKARDFVGSMSLADFAADEKTLYAVIRALEIAGEAAKRVPDAGGQPVEHIRTQLLQPGLFGWRRTNLRQHRSLPWRRREAQSLASVARNAL